MSKKSTRTSFVALSAGLFVVLSLNTVPSAPSIPEEELSNRDLEEVLALESLAEWLVGGDGGALQALSPRDLTAEIKQKPRSFELLRTYTESASQRDQLHALPYGRSISRVADRHHLDGLLVAAVIEAESSFSPEAISPAGALGLMQILPTTGELFGAGDLLDPEVNLEVGARYLSRLLYQFDGNLELALAAYNAGPGNVNRYGGVPPFQETQAYVGKVLSIYVNHHKSVWDDSGSTDLLALP